LSSSDDDDDEEEDDDDDEDESSSSDDEKIIPNNNRKANLVNKGTPATKKGRSAVLPRVNHYFNRISHLCL